MSYIISIKKQGTIINRLTVTADNALAAREQAEAAYKATVMAMGDRLVKWTGLEFEARRNG